MNNSILGIVILLGLGGALTTMIVGIVMAAQRKWRGGVVCLILFFVSLGLFAGATACWFANAFHTVRSTMASRGVAEAAREAKRIATRNETKALTPEATRIDPEFWETDGTPNRDRLPIRYPFEINTLADPESGTLYQNIAAGKSQHPDTQLKPAGISDIVDFAVDGNMLLYRTEDGLHKEAWGLFTFATESKTEFTSAPAMWKEAKSRGWTHPEELKSVEDHMNAYWFGM